MTDVISFGCRLNTYEGEVVRAHAAHLRDTVVVNTCAVTAEAERQARQAVSRLRRERPGTRIVVTGCAAQVAPEAWAALPGVARVLGNRDKLRPESWAEDAFGNAPGLDGPGAKVSVSDIMAVPGGAAETAARPAANLPVTGVAARARAVVQVQQGCDHRCTFCIIPYGRGPSRSVPVGAVVEQARALVAAGYRELMLTGVDLTGYGPDLPGQPSLGQLCRRLLALVPELPRLRLSSLDPVEIDQELWRLVAEEPRLMPHLHLSVQSGSDMVLKRMRRRHLRADGLRAVARARSLRPEIALGADLIAGFPTETDEQFAETLAFVEEAALPYLHVFPYSERPGTAAARMPAVPRPVRRERAARLREAGRAQAARFHAGLVGSSVEVVAERGGTGRTEHFAPVRLSRPALPGTILRGKVASADADGLLVEAA